MYILGISGDCEHTSSVCLMSDNRIIYAESEERITRKKNDGSFPINAIRHSLSLVPKNDELIIAAVGNQYLTADVISSLTSVRNISVKLREFCWFDLNLYSCPLLDGYSISRFEHHLCHARAATTFSRFEEATVLVADGQGDEVTFSAWSYQYGELKNIWKNYLHQGSIGFLYAAVTEYLGFKRLQDEGKVTALAAAGVVNDSLMSQLQIISKVYTNNNKLPVYCLSKVVLNEYVVYKSLYSSYMENLLRGYNHQDIAATIQKHCEDLIAKILTLLHDKFGIRNLILSGGLFANVSLNHSIAKLPFIKGLDICPPMGDEGTSIGAAAELMHCKMVAELKSDNVYLGYDIDIENPNLCDLFPLYRFTRLQKDQQIEKCIDYLINGEPVCLAFGRGEFGPRALGGRSILLRPNDKTAQKWLNNKLGRDNVMPFAPCIRDCDISEYSLPLSIKSNTDGYMTIRREVSEEFQKLCSGVVHIDGTARFQVVSKETNKFLWEILTAFKAKTGLPALLNTSLNRHGYPIARTLHDVLECASISDFPVICVNNGLIEKTSCHTKINWNRA